MQYEDYLEKEIQKLGTLLKELLSIFVKGQNFGDTNQIENFITSKLKIELNLPVHDLKSLNSEDIFKIGGFQKLENIEMLAELFINISNTEECNSKSDYLRKGLELYLLIENKTRTFSFERNARILQLKEILGEN